MNKQINLVSPAPFTPIRQADTALQANPRTYNIVLYYAYCIYVYVHKVKSGHTLQMVFDKVCKFNFFS